MLHLITGGSGFVGSAIAHRLAADGHAVRVLDLWRAKDLPPAVEFVQGDVTDPAAVAAAMRGIAFVHHNAALVPLTKSRKRFQTVNVEGTRIVLEAARKVGVRMFAHMSSSTVFGSPAALPITDATPRQPIEPYGKAKKAGEDLVLAAQAAGQPAAIIRPRTVIGPRRLGIFEILFGWIRDGANIPIIGAGDNLFQFVHVEDIVSASIQCCLQEVRGAFNIGAEKFGTLREDLEFLCRYAGTDSRVVSLPVGPAIAALRILDWCRLSPLAPWHYLTYSKPFYFDPASQKRIPGFQPRYDNRAMLTEAYDWYIRHFDANAAFMGTSVHKRPVRQGILKLAKFICSSGWRGG